MLRLAGNLNLSFGYVDGEALLLDMQDSTGCQFRQCLHVGQSAAEPCVASLGPVGRRRAQQPAVRAGAV